jgi:hypothetical protein
MVIEGDFERARSACYFVLHSIDATGTVRTGSPG